MVFAETKGPRHVTNTTRQTRFYVTVVRGTKRGWLAGPFSTYALAQRKIPKVRAVASQIDPWCDFDAFGVASITRDGHGFPNGVLNSRID